MKSLKLNRLWIAILCSHAYAANGPLFSITESGAPTNTPVSITVCLNSTAHLSCQTFNVITLGLIIKTTIPNRTYSTVGIRVNTPGYSIASSETCAPLANGFCQFTTSNTMPVSINLSNGETSIAQYLYIPSTTGLGASDGYLEQGLLASNGSLSTYVTTPSTNKPDWFPSGLAFATALETTHAYISSAGVTVGVFMCDLSSDGDGALSNCSLTGVGVSYFQPQGVAIATSNNIQYAYIPDYEVDSNYALHKCRLNPTDGTLINCENTPDSDNTPWSNPSAIAFATAGNTQYAYVTGYDVNNQSVVYQCTVNDNNGQLNSCSTTGNLPTGIANGIALATYQDQRYAYITKPDNGTVYRCLWDDNDGSLSTCVDAASFKHDWTLKGIAFGTVKGTQYAYVSDSQPSYGVWQCTVDVNTGLFTTCTQTPSSQTAPTWWVNGSVAMYPVSTSQ